MSVLPPFTPTRVFILADCEGAFTRVQLALRSGGLIDAAGRWSAPTGTLLVQLGDITDRGDRAIELMLYLADLAGQAEAAGSRLELVLGNHEAFATASGGGDLEAASMWGGNGWQGVLREVEERGMLAAALALDSLYIQLGQARGIDSLLRFGGNDTLRYFVAGIGRLLYGGSEDHFWSTHVRDERDVEARDEVIPGVLAPYLSRARAFVQVGEMFFAHGGVSRWLAQEAEPLGSLAALETELNHVWRDPARRSRTPLGRRFLNTIGRARGGDCTPDETGVAWLDFDREQRPALGDESVRALLRESGIAYGFFGHTPAPRPRLIRVGETGAAPLISLRDNPTRPATQIGVELSVYGLDCGLRSDRQSRSHLYEWDLATQTLNFYGGAEPSELDFDRV